jgi:hypothetical protein
MTIDLDLKALTDEELKQRIADLKLGKAQHGRGRGQEAMFARTWYNRELNLTDAELRRRGINLHADDGWQFPGVSGAKETA